MSNSKDILDKLKNFPTSKEKKPTSHKDFREWLKNEDLWNNIKLRKVLAYWSFGIISAWIILVAIVLFDNKCLELSENIIITMLVTTTANILGLPIIVLKNLFPAQDNNNEI